jgi:glycerophosphoryl diester phosphodiesterase
MLQSFDAANLTYARAIDPAIPVALLVENHAELEEAIRERWPAVHARQNLLDESSVAALRSEGISIGAWTVNEEEDVRRIVLLRPDRIITDVPRRVRRMIEKLESRGVRESRGGI